MLGRKRKASVEKLETPLQLLALSANHHPQSGVQIAKTLKKGSRCWNRSADPISSFVHKISFAPLQAVTHSVDP